jgi:RNA polymerase sigma factor (sigma-70 family)
MEDFLAELYRRWYPALYRYALAVLGSPEEAEEVVQEAFLVALEKEDVLRGAEHPERWLVRTTKHKLLHALRARGRTQGMVYLDQEGTPEPAAPAVRDRLEEEEALQGTIGTLRQALTPEELALVEMIAFRKTGYAAAAEQLGLSVWACQKRMQRARKKLRKFFPKGVWGHG